MGTGVGVGMSVGVGIGVGVGGGVGVSVGIGVGVSVGTGVGVGMSVGVGVGVSVGIGVGVSVGVDIGVSVAVGVGVGGGVAAAAGVGVYVGDGVAVSVGVLVGTLVVVTLDELAASPGPSDSGPSVHPAGDIATIPIIKPMTMARRTFFRKLNGATSTRITPFFTSLLAVREPTSNVIAAIVSHALRALRQCPRLLPLVAFSRVVASDCGCQGRRQNIPVGRSKSVPPEIIGQRKCPRQLFRRSVPETGWQQAGRVSEDGFWRDL